MDGRNGSKAADYKNGETIKGGKTKVDRYGWVPLGARGRFMEIDKASLLIPVEYQRELEDDKVKKMAANWSWPAFGVASVAERADGFYVFDAGHRVAAAKRRADITTLPCMVYRFADLSSEAQEFLNANCLRKPMSAIQRFKAQVITADPHVALVARLMESVGREARNSNGPTCVRCVRELTNMAKKNPVMFEKLWPTIDAVSFGQPVEQVIAAGLFYIEERIPGTMTDIHSKYRKRAIEFGSAELKKGALSAAAYFAKGGPKRWAQGMVNVINKGLRERLKIVDDE